MRFKTSLYNFLLLVLVVVILQVSGYYSLKSILTNQAQEQAQMRADFLSSRLKNPEYKGKVQEIINEIGTFENGYAWIVDDKGKYIAYPMETQKVKVYGRDRDWRDISAKGLQKDAPAFITGVSVEQRMIYTEALPDGTYLVISRNINSDRTVLDEYMMFNIYLGVGLILILMLPVYFLSKYLLKPVYALQDFANSLVVGEYIDSAEKMKEPDVVSIGIIMERFYYQLRQEKSKDRNPISGLPGNKSLCEALSRRIQTRKDLAVGFADIKDFTAFGNKYGKERGESVIRYLSVIVLNAVSELGNSEDKIFHLGADRLIFISTPDKIKNICEKILKDFDGQIKSFYDEKALEAGHIVSIDKEGSAGEFPIMPLHISVTTSLSRVLNHPLQIGHIVGEIRTYLRSRQTSAYLIDRRNCDRGDEFSGTKSPFIVEDWEDVEEELKKIRESDSFKKNIRPVKEILADDDIQVVTEEAEAGKKIDGDSPEGEKSEDEEKKEDGDSNSEFKEKSEKQNVEGEEQIEKE